MLSALGRVPDDALVATLAAANVHTSDVAMGQSVTSARALARALSPQGFRVFEKIDGLIDPYRERAQGIIATVHDALRRDEHVTPLGPSLQLCQSQALDLLAEAATKPADPAPEPPPPQPARKTDQKKGARDEPGEHRTVAATNLGAVFKEIEAAVRESGATQVEIEWKVFTDEGEPGNTS